MAGPSIGQPAPDFTLEGTDGPFTLSEHRGERVVLLFYPGDETPVCTRQFCSYRDRAEDMSALPATVVGISAQDVASHESFVASHGLTVQLLADAGAKVAKAYGVHAPIIGTRRGVVIVDEAGRVAFRHVHATGLAFQTVDDIAQALAGLPAAA